MKTRFALCLIGILGYLSLVSAQNTAAEVSEITTITLTEELTTAKTQTEVEAAIAKAIEANIPLEEITAIAKAVAVKNPLLARLTIPKLIATIRGQNDQGGTNEPNQLQEIEPTGNDTLQTELSETNKKKIPKAPLNQNVGIIGGSTTSKEPSNIPAGGTNAIETGSTYN
ncbi:hypothetical protein SH580_06620 [Coraliomargarita algicola]|uniref:Uncharacterized protein n=1 Tax=Coraliomargarita algicola TaxID=3092156 RepID=A0ABZ0RPM9_9BACT|nr:hypothetical protein [Coraliomargarita sp. J2-16]WPJ97381.1 hypothetical protein SH580_06620 [Coraliomargarita sp. J2-16]